MSFRIKMLTAYLVIGDDDEEGVMSIEDRRTGMHMPLICADDERIASFRDLAQLQANRMGKPVRLVRFSVREDLETISPKRSGN